VSTPTPTITADDARLVLEAITLAKLLEPHRPRPLSHHDETTNIAHRLRMLTTFLLPREDLVIPTHSLRLVREASVTNARWARAQLPHLIADGRRVLGYINERTP
jgi:hypothetical protein